LAKTILFVYGTLKRGNSANHRLAGQRFLREAVTEPRHRLYNLGWYPGLVKDEANGPAVTGELWEVDERCLAGLDDYECAPELYVRGRVAIRGVADPVETYFYNRPTPPAARSGAAWPFPAAGGEG
jgi:gamma-glutamylaminecyclotransferase